MKISSTGEKLPFHTFSELNTRRTLVTFQQVSLTSALIFVKMIENISWVINIFEDNLNMTWKFSKYNFTDNWRSGVDSIFLQTSRTSYTSHWVVWWFRLKPKDDKISHLISSIYVVGVERDEVYIHNRSNQ